MRKLSTVLLTTLIVLTLAACGGNKAAIDKAYARFEAANQKLGEVTSAEMAIKSTVSVKSGETTENADVDMTMKMVIKGENNFDAEMKMTMPDTPGETTIYMVDNMAYYDMESMGAGRFKIDMSNITEMAKQVESQMSGVQFEKDQIEKTQTEKLDNGDTKILIWLKPDAMNEMLDQVMSATGQSADLASTEAKMSNISYYVVLDEDDTFKTYGLEMDMVMTASGETVEMHIKMDAEYLGFNNIDKITPPGDLDEYEEIDASLIGL